MKYNSDLSIRHKRQSTRLPTHNYGWSGTYFVTIRVIQREPYFEIPELRAILVEVWQTLPKRFPNVTLDEFVIMPDHIHFILWLDGTPGKELTLGKIIAAYKSLTTVLWLQHLKSVGKDMYSPCRIW